LRHEIFLFSLQFSATFINLAQYGQSSSENQAHKVNFPQMGKCLGQLLGNKIDRALVLTFMSHIRPVPSPQGDYVD